MDDLDRVIGQRIQQQRAEKLKLTQEQLRDRLAKKGFSLASNSRLSEIENGKRSLTASQLRAVSEALDISIMELMEPLDERGKLVGGVSDSLYDLVDALSSLAAACGAMDEAGLRGVTLAEIMQDNIDLAGALSVAHPLVRRWWGQKWLPELLEDGFSRREAARRAAKRGNRDAAVEAEVLRVGDKTYEHMGDETPAELFKDPTGYTNTETIKGPK